MKDKWVPSLVGGIVMALLNNIPGVSLINLLCCAGLWSGGVVAGWMYKRQTGRFFSMGEGALMGLIASIIGAIVATIAFATVGQAAVQSAFEQLAQTSPELADLDFTAGATTAIIFFQWILYLIFGVIGGLLGAALFGRDRSQNQIG